MITTRTATRLVLSALALVASLAACTAQIETDGIAPAARTITVDPGTKPTYNTTNANTRTNPTTGKWEVGDKVEVEITFYDDNKDIAGDNQTLTCIAAATTSPGVNPAQWIAAPAIIVAPAAATKVSATYSYTSVADPRTDTKEQINGSVAETPMPITGTLVLPSPTWKRNTALVVVENIPVGKSAKIEYVNDNLSTTVGNEWKNETGASAPANFHLLKSDANTFSLLIDNVATPYTAVKYILGKKYTLDANQKPGTEGGDTQIINASSDAITGAIFNNTASPYFNITGTNVGSVKAALMNTTKKIHLTMPDVTTEVGENAFYDCGSLATVSMPAVTTIGKEAFIWCSSLTSISLPKAEDIGEYAFNKCPALTTVSLTAATTIENNAFYNCGSLTDVDLTKAEDIGKRAFCECTALKTISLPAATKLWDYVFENCTDLTTIKLPAATFMNHYVFKNCADLTHLELTAATEIKVNRNAFDDFPNGANLTLVLHSSAAQANNAMGIIVATDVDGKRTVTFTKTIDGFGNDVDDRTIIVKAVLDPDGNPITTAAD